MNKVKRRVIIVAIGILFLTMYLPVLYIHNILTEIINIFSIIIFCPLFILMFSDILDSDNLKQWEYFGIHLIYTFLPIGLIVQYSFYEEKWKFLVSFLITLITSLINMFILYNKVKQIHRKHLKYLKYSNLFLMTVFTILFAILNLFIKIPETVLFLFCISPLLILQLAYERIDLKE